MARIPVFTNETGVAAYRAPQGNPAAMGVAGAALARAGGDVADAAFQWHERYQNARRQADAADLMAKASKQLGDAQFRWSKVADRQEALIGFDEEAKTFKDKLLEGVEDTQVKNLVTRQYDEEAIMRSLNTGNAAFTLESSRRRGALTENLTAYAQSAATATSELLRASIVDNATMAVDGAVAAGWLNPEAGAQAKLDFKSSLAEVQVNRALNAALDAQNPDIADGVIEALADPGNFSDLAPGKREQMLTRAENMAYRLAGRQAANVAKADAEAARDLRATQTANEARLLTDIHTNKPVDPAELERMGYTQQLSPEGLRAVYAAIDRRDAGQDDPVASTRLWEAVTKKTAAPDDIYAALNSRVIKGETAAAMMRALTSKDEQGDNAVARQNFSQLRTALGGDAIEKGLIDFTGAERAGQVALWAQAQGEWTARVTVGQEDSQAVLADMLPRYSRSPAPTWLPAPRMGAVTTPEDMNAIALRTRQAFQAQEIDQRAYDEQVELLNQYRRFFATRGTPPPAAAPRPSTSKGGGAQILGVSPAK